MKNKQKQFITPQTISEDSAKDIKKVAKGAGISLFGSVAGRGLWFLCQVIIARFFGAEVFGIYILGLTVLKMTELLARFGLHTGAMRFVSIYRKDDPGKVKGTLISAALFSFANGILIGGLVYLSSGFISEFLFHKPELTEVIKTFAVCVPFMATMMVVATASRGFHTTKYYVYVKDIIQSSANIVFVVLFLLLGFGIFGIISAFVISYIIGFIAGLYFISRQFPEIKERTIQPIYEHKTLLIYSAPLLFSGFLGFLISWTDVIMLGFMKTSMEVGIYRAASQVPIFLLLLVTASNSIYGPIIAEMHHKHQTKRLEKIFKTTTRWVFLLTFPAALIFVFSAKEVISLFGSDFIGSGVPVLMILTIAQFINCITSGVGLTLKMIGKQNMDMLNSVALAVMNIVLNYFLIPAYGSLGAAIATGVSIVAVNLLRLLEIYIIYKIHPYSIDYIQGIISGVIAVIILFFLGEHLPNHSNIMGLVSNIIVVSATFITLMFIMGIRDEDRALFDVFAGKTGMHFFKR